MTNQDHIWHILDDVLLLLAGQHYPTPERTYKLDGGWSLALADLKRCFADLRAKLALVEAERDAARAGEARAVEALEKILVGGNHLASALTGMFEDRLPPYGTDFNEARRAFAGSDEYDLWVCWAVIMRVRDSLSDPQPALDWLAQQRREAAVEALEGIGAKQTSASGPAAQKVETLIFLADTADKLARLDCELIDRAAMAQRATLFRECAAMMRERGVSEVQWDTEGGATKNGLYLWAGLVCNGFGSLVLKGKRQLYLDWHPTLEAAQAAAVAWVDEQEGKDV